MSGVLRPEWERIIARQTAFTPAPLEAQEYVEALSEIFFLGRNSRGSAFPEEIYAKIHRTAWKLFNLAKYGRREDEDVPC